jgi:PAS domain S-box-containing protein
MSIRTKTLLAILCTVAVLFSGAFFVISREFIGRFDKLELVQSQENLDRVRAQIKQDFDYMKSKISDWAIWDDAYVFVKDANPDFVKTNLGEATLTNLKIDLMVFSRNDGTVIYDFENASSSGRSVPTALSSLIRTDPYFKGATWSDDIRSGFVLVDNQPLMFTAQKVVHSDGSGPSEGIVLFGTWLTKPYVDNVGEKLKLDLSFDVISSATPNAHIEKELAEKKDELISVESEQLIEADMFLKDIYDTPVVYMHIALPRLIHAQGIQLTRYIVYVVVVGVFILVIVLSMLLDGLVLRRIFRIDALVGKIGRHETQPESLHAFVGSDEVGKLAGILESTFTSIEKTQALLDQAKSHAQTYLDTIPVLMVALDPSGVIQTVNKKGCEILGYQQNELIGKSWIDTCIPERYRNDIRTVHHKIVQGDLSIAATYENLVVTRDGRELQFYWHNNVVSENGVIVGTISAGEDITVKHKEDTALRESEERFRLVAKQTKQLVYDYDLASGRISWAGAILETTGYTPEEFASVDIKQWEERIHPDERKVVLDALEQARKNNTDFASVYRFQQKNGAYGYFEDHGVFLTKPDGTAYRLLGTMKEVTQEMKYKEEIERLAAVIRNTNEFVGISTFAGDITFLNNAGSRMLGIDPAEVAKHNIREFVAPECVPMIEQDLMPALQSKGIWEGDLAYINVQTRERTDVHSITFVIKNIRTGISEFYANVSQNITERKKAEEAIKNRSDELERANQLMVGRELKMMELKKEIDELKKQLLK